MLMSLLKVQAHMNVIVNHWCWGRWWWLACFPYIKKKTVLFFFPVFPWRKLSNLRSACRFMVLFIIPARTIAFYGSNLVLFVRLYYVFPIYIYIYAPGVHVLFSIKRGHLHPKTHPLALVTFWEKMTIMVKSNLDIICN